MKLYYSQGACSLASHIALREADLPLELEPVNLKTHNYRGGDFKQLNPNGYVPVLELPGGELLSESSAILQYIADQKPEKNLLPKFGTLERYRSLEFLNFIATEIHKSFGPLWNPKASDEAKEAAKANLKRRLDSLNSKLKDKKFLLGDDYSVADSYLFTCLNWAPILHFDMTPWPALQAHYERVKARPATVAAMKAEGLLK